MNYKDIAEEILKDPQLIQEYNLEDNPKLHDGNIISRVLNAIAIEKDEHRNEQKTNTAKVTRALNKIFDIK